MEFEKMLRSLEPELLGGAAAELLARLGLAPAGESRAKAREVKAPEVSTRKAVEAEAETEPVGKKTAGKVEEEEPGGKSAEMREVDELQADTRESYADFFEFEEAERPEVSDWLRREAKKIGEPETLRREGMKRSSGIEDIAVHELSEERQMPAVREFAPELRSPSAKEISDFFRRDSRRYDRGFKRY